MARIPYVNKDKAPKEVAEIFAKMEANGAPVLNLWKMAANSPATLPHLIRLGNSLLTKTSLSPKLREMAILRVAELLSCEYEKQAHVPFGLEVGMTTAQVKDIGRWESSQAFDPVERAVLAFTDEVAKGGVVRDETFAALAANLNAMMIMELAQAVGFYGMLARILLAFKVDLQTGAPSSSTQITGRPSK